jgi:hypothetical protein
MRPDDIVNQSQRDSFPQGGRWLCSPTSRVLVKLFFHWFLEAWCVFGAGPECQKMQPTKQEHCEINGFWKLEPVSKVGTRTLILREPIRADVCVIRSVLDLAKMVRKSICQDFATRLTTHS